MPRYAAFLRGLNVGGHRIKMDRLRGLFEDLGFTDVASYIASGNIVFSAPETDVSSLRQRIESHLEASLGYSVATFLRTLDELAAIAAHEAFSADEAQDAACQLVMFTAEPFSEEAREVAGELCRPGVDELRFHGLETYWLCRGMQHESKLSGAKLMKAIGGPVTIRNLKTVNKMAAKLPPEE